MNSTQSRSREVPNIPAIFKYNGQVYLFIALLAIDSLFLFLGFAVAEGRHIRQEPFSTADLFGCGLLLIFFFIQVPLLRRRSDIVVDNQGISRRFIWWTWQTVRWNNVQVIKIFPHFDSNLKKTIKLINIIPSGSLGGMGFSDQISGVDELIDILNYYITQHKIKIELVNQTGTTIVTHL